MDSSAHSLSNITAAQSSPIQTQTVEISNEGGERLAFVSLAEDNMHFSILIAVVMIFLICLCIIAFCVIRQQYKFKQMQQRKLVQRQNMFNRDINTSRAMHRPHHVISCSPHSTTFHDVISPKRTIYSPQSNQSNIVISPLPITPISANQHSEKRYPETMAPIVYPPATVKDRKYKEGVDSMGDITNVIKQMVDEYDEESTECKEHVLDRRETDIGYDELMRRNENDGSSDDTQCSQLADDEFEIKGDDDDSHDTHTINNQKEELSIVIDDDMISLMSIGSLSEKQREGKYLKTERKSNLFEAIQEDFLMETEEEQL